MKYDTLIDFLWKRGDIKTGWPFETPIIATFLSGIVFKTQC